MIDRPTASPVRGYRQCAIFCMIAPLIAAAIFYGLGGAKNLSETASGLVALGWAIAWLAFNMLAGLATINRTNDARGLYASARSPNVDYDADDSTCVRACRDAEQRASGESRYFHKH